MKLASNSLIYNLTWGLVSLWLSILLAWPMFGTYLIHPNRHMYAFGGDPLTLYYNVSYHTCYGAGTHLTSMNYPEGELIFLTDAQGSLSVLLSFIHRHIMDLCDYTVGIVNGLGMLSFGVSVVLIYLIYRALDIVAWRAAVFGALTAVMAPQLHRLIGHHGLSYVFLLPLTLLWLIRKSKIQRFEWRDLGFAGLLLFFTLNNPYVGFGAGFMVMLTALIWWSIHRKDAWKTAYVAMLGFLPLISTFLYFRMADHVTDRVKMQWGFFHYKAKLEGLLAPPNSLIDKLLVKYAGRGFTMDFESIANLGFPVVAILFGFFGVWLFKRRLLSGFSVSPVLKAVVMGSFILFVYASAVLFMPFPQDFVENWLGPMLMFKASARLAWPFWYALVALAMVLVEQLIKRMSFSGYLYTLVLILVTWFLDYSLYRQPMFNNTVQPNFFSKNDNQEMVNLLRDNKIEPAAYQGIFLLPKLMSWTDHFISEPNFFNQFFGMRISKATGLPIISAMLSRMSIGQTAERIEFLSDPLILKSLHHSFPDKRPILVLRGKGDPSLKYGEQYLEGLCDTLLEHKDFTLLTLPLERINQYALLKSIENGEISPDSNLSSDAYLHMGWDDQSMEKSYGGKGAAKAAKGESLMARFTPKTAAGLGVYLFGLVFYRSF
ncbi:MAG: hypothetical protein IPN29_08380 [Saprospiraceae bacterium]|nr:hypothetical protein [Saprospiraceae bacterium]